MGTVIIKIVFIEFLIKEIIPIVVTVVTTKNTLSENDGLIEFRWELLHWSTSFVNCSWKSISIDWFASDIDSDEEQLSGNGLGLSGSSISIKE